MSCQDAAFLEEVDDFLVSFDLPIFPALQSLDIGHGDEVSATDAVKKEAAQPLNNAKKSKGRKTKEELDPAAKHELEKAKDRKRRSVYRERRRVEKERLQQQVGELTAELTQLQRANEAERSLASSAWEMVAKRQLLARVNAEDEQRRLITAIESRAALIYEFQSAMHNNLNNDHDDGAYQHKRIRLEPSDAEFFKAFVMDLDHFYAQTDEALRNYGLYSTDAGWDQPRRQWKEDGKTGYHVYTDKYTLPFPFQQVCRFSWQVAQMQHRQEDREHFDGVDDPENTSAFKFRVTTRLNSGRSVSVLQHAVVRRYVRDDRAVVVWRSFTEGEGMFTGMHADESGWCVSIPLSSSPESNTLIRTIMRHVPMHFRSKSTEDVAARQFTGLLLESGTEDACEIGNRMEKLLLQDK